MKIPSVRVPVSLLLDSALSPAARLVWMTLHLHAQSNISAPRVRRSEPAPAGGGSTVRTPGPSGTNSATGTKSVTAAGPARIAALSGLVRPTILRALPRLAAAGWCTLGPGHLATAIDGAPGDARVSVPVDLLADVRVGIRAKLLYGVLQRVPGFGHLKVRPGAWSRCGGQFTYAAISQLARASRNAMKRAVHDLVQGNWLQVEQKNRLAPLCFTLRNPIAEYAERQIAQARERLLNAEHYGESLMRELLRLLVDSNNYEDDAAPGFMENPLTHKCLQLDRYYPPGVAFEYNGPQHCVATKRYTQAEVDEQRLRDLIKQGLCMNQGIRLVIVHTEDLSLQGMRQKVGDLLPLRDLTPHGALIDFLESECRTHRREAINGKFSTPVRAGATGPQAGRTKTAT